jgi:amidase
LRAAGAKVRDVALPVDFSNLADAQITIMVREVAQSLSYERLMHSELLSREMVAMIEAGLAVTTAQYDAARALARRCRAMLPQVMESCDVLIAPSTMGEAPAGIQATGDPLFNRIWTLLRGPCVHVPIARGPHGLPLGVTIAGPMERDRETLLGAHWIHRQF